MHPAKKGIYLVHCLPYISFVYVFLIVLKLQKSPPLQQKWQIRVWQIMAKMAGIAKFSGAIQAPPPRPPVGRGSETRKCVLTHLQYLHVTSKNLKNVL